MSNSRVLVFGRTGQLGWELRHKLACLGPVATAGSPEVDFAKPETIREAVRAVFSAGRGPAVIVNAAAYTAVDKAESEEEIATRINGAGAGLVAAAARRQGAPVWSSTTRSSARSFDIRSMVSKKLLPRAPYTQLVRKIR